MKKALISGITGQDRFIAAEPSNNAGGLFRIMWAAGANLNESAEARVAFPLSHAGKICKDVET